MRSIYIFLKRLLANVFRIYLKQIIIPGNLKARINQSILFLAGLYSKLQQIKAFRSTDKKGRLSEITSTRDTDSSGQADR